MHFIAEYQKQASVSRFHLNFCNTKEKKPVVMEHRFHYNIIIHIHKMLRHICDSEQPGVVFILDTWYETDAKNLHLLGQNTEHLYKS